MLEILTGTAGVAALIAAVELLALVGLLQRPSRRGGSSLVDDATRLGLRSRALHR